MRVLVYRLMLGVGALISLCVMFSPFNGSLLAAMNLSSPNTNTVKGCWDGKDCGSNGLCGVNNLGDHCQCSGAGLPVNTCACSKIAPCPPAH